MKTVITTYRIKRNHSNETGFFIVNVQKVHQVGIGFQLNIFGVLYGISIYVVCKETNIYGLS